jgi:hypothetical protein
MCRTEIRVPLNTSSPELDSLGSRLNKQQICFALLLFGSLFSVRKRTPKYLSGGRTFVPDLRQTSTPPVHLC